MATGEVKRMYARNAIPVLVIDRTGKPKWSEVFENNPKIARNMQRVHQRLLNAGGDRPYIAAKMAHQWFWKPYRPEPGELFFTAEELAFAEPYRGRVLIEPTVKANKHTNKAWFLDRWAIVGQRLGGRALHCGHVNVAPLGNVEYVITPTFRLACALLSVCKAFVGTEGGLMHAAAAVNVPAVILWSEFIAPNITGYDSHIHIRHAKGACGKRVQCESCVRSMDAITVDEVLEATERIIG